MKKYFMKGVDEPLEFGDKIGFDIIKEVDDKSVTKNVEVNFIPEIVPFLLELGVIEEKEVEKEKNTIDFTDNAEDNENDEMTLNDLAEYLGEFSGLVTGILEKMNERIKKLEDNTEKPDSTGRSYETISDYLKRHKNIFKAQPNWIYNPSVETFSFMF